MTELRPTTPEDLASLDALFRAGFGHAFGPDEWTWKYRQLPGRGKSMVAVRDGEVIAHAGAILLPARWHGGEGGIWQLVDFVGTPRAAGLRPPLVALGHALLSDVPGDGSAPWTFGFPSERHHRLGERVFGYQQTGTVEELVGPLPEEAAPSRGLRDVADTCGPWAETAWERCGVLGVRRSVSFLLWRYWARPRRYYRFYRLAAGGVEGFAVFAFVGEEAWAAEAWLPPGQDWRPALLAAAADLRATGLQRWRFWPPVLPALGPLYAALGLRPSGERRIVDWRWQPKDPAPVEAARGFTYSMGDYDVV